MSEVDRIARMLIAEWERVEGQEVNVSYYATFADMARAMVKELDSVREEGYREGFTDGHQRAASEYTNFC